MSPRAAWRFESLGFSQVYDYAAGAADWFASGLPREGRDAAMPRAGDVARADVPTCNLNDRVGEVQATVRAAGWDQCVVVNEERVVLGRLRTRAMAAPPETAVERVMEAGPATIRPHTRLDSMRDRLRQRFASDILVTTSDGRLVGALRREDAEHRLGIVDDASSARLTP